MRHDWLTRPHGTRFASVVAHGYHKIELHVFELFPGFAPRPRCIDVVNVLQTLNRKVIDFTRRKRTSTEDLKARPAEPPQQILANDTARGIARAQKQKFVGLSFH